MKQVWNQSFKGGTISLDGCEYVNCTFEDVIFEYEGTGPTRMTNCRFVNKPQRIEFGSRNPVVKATIFIIEALHNYPDMHDKGIVVHP